MTPLRQTQRNWLQNMQIQYFTQMFVSCARSWLSFQYCVEVERSFSCVRCIHTWLKSSLTIDKLSGLAVIAMHGHSVPFSINDICTAFMPLHPHKMKSSLLFEYKNPQRKIFQGLAKNYAVVVYNFSTLRCSDIASSTHRMVNSHWLPGEYPTPIS